MPITPKPRSFQQILNQMIKTFTAKSGVNDQAPGSVARSLVEAAALSDFQSQGDIYAALNSNDVDRAEGIDLDNIGIAHGVTRPENKAAYGSVTFYSENITKISTKIYAGTAAPPKNSTTIYVSDASKFSSTGSLYIGRGSNNVEGPLAYSSIAQVGSYYQITLTTATTKNHNLNEEVTLAQGGNRVIPVGTVAQTSSGNATPPTTFRTLSAVTILDGNREVTNVPVLCNVLGVRGNATANSIVNIASKPFPGAAVTNPLPFITGQDAMLDPDYRLLIKQSEQTKTKGTDLALQNAAVGVTSSDDNKTVVSAQIKKPTNRNEPGVVYIDDSTAYQPIFSGQGFETLVENAIGGEKYLTLSQEDVTKALLETSFERPYALTADMVLAVKCGGVLYEHTFASSDFNTQFAADVFEVVNSINANTSLGFSARASQNNKKIVIFSKNYTSEDVQIVAPLDSTKVNANDYLGFSENVSYTLRLYKNDNLLVKDGASATVYSLLQDSWSTLASTEYLCLSVDNSLPITYTFTSADFVSYGYGSMIKENPLSVWAQVIQSKISGVTVVAESGKLSITSNKGASNSASIVIYNTVQSNNIGPSMPNNNNLATKFFGLSISVPETLQSVGLASDYVFNRSTGELQLSSPLVKGDILTAGSKNTRAMIDSKSTATGYVSISAQLLISPPAPTSNAMFVVVDSPATIISNLASPGSSITISNVSTNIQRITSSNSLAFSDVAVGDWIILASDQIYSALPSAFGAYKISNKTSSYVDVQALNSSFAGLPLTINLTGTQKIITCRTNGHVQKVPVTLVGSQTVLAIANDINTSLVGAKASSVGGKVLRLTSNSFEAGHTTHIVSSSGVESIGFTNGQTDVSTTSHTAFNQSGKSDLTFINFETEFVASNGSHVTSPVDSIILTASPNLTNKDLVVFENSQTVKSANKDLYASVYQKSPGTVQIRNTPLLSDVAAGSRFYSGVPYNFSSDDNLTVVLDQDGLNKSFNIKMSRKGVINNQTSPTSSLISMYDADAGPTSGFAAQFGDNFDFADYKIHMKAFEIFNQSNPTDQIKIQSVIFGPTGEKICFGFRYPSIPNSSMSNSVEVSDITKISLYLQTGAERLGGGWTSSTQFDVTVTGNTARFTHNGTGSAPSFVTSALVSVGDIVNVDNSSGFDLRNCGQFKVTAVTDTYFEALLPSAFVQSSIQINAASAIRFYRLGTNNKVSDVVTYITNNLSAYIKATALGVGTSQVVNDYMVDLQVPYNFLKAGENAVSISNIGSTITNLNQFSLKDSLPSGFPSLLVGEEAYLIPTRAEHLEKFLNVFAVTGLSSVGNITVSNDGNSLQIFSDVYGSLGAVLVSGGTANSVVAPLVQNSAILPKASIASATRYRAGSFVIYMFNTDLTDSLPADKSEIFFGFANNSFNTAGGVINMAGPSLVQRRAIFMASTFVDPNISSVVRSSNTAVYTLASSHKIIVGDVVTISGVADSSFNGVFAITNVSSNTITTVNVGANTSSTGGQIDSVKTGPGTLLFNDTQFSIDKTSSSGLDVNAWIKVQNSATQDKSLGFKADTQLTLTSVNSADSSTVAISAGSGTFSTLVSIPHSINDQILLRQEGQFTVITQTSAVSVKLLDGGIAEGSWIRIVGSDFSVNNQGIFKVAKVHRGSNDSIYFENPIAEEQSIVLTSASAMLGYTYDSVMPGDSITIGTDILGVSNVNTYTVSNAVFPTSSTLYVKEILGASATAVLGNDYSKVHFVEKNPWFAYKKIVNIAQDPTNSKKSIVTVLGSELANKATTATSSYIEAQSKLKFSTSIKVGEDSYKYYNGLISAVGRKIRGQAYDTVSFPGYAAAGSYLVVDAPLPKRIQVGIVIRNTSGIPFATIKSRVETTASSYINSLKVGESVIFSKLISEIQKVNGVQAISISSPTYNSSNDSIMVGYGEKAQILNISTDVVVTLAT